LPSERGGRCNLGAAGDRHASRSGARDNRDGVATPEIVLPYPILDKPDLPARLLDPSLLKLIQFRIPAQRNASALPQVPGNRSPFIAQERCLGIESFGAHPLPPSGVPSLFGAFRNPSVLCKGDLAMDRRQTPGIDSYAISVAHQARS